MTQTISDNLIVTGTLTPGKIDFGTVSIANKNDGTGSDGKPYLLNQAVNYQLDQATAPAVFRAEEVDAVVYGSCNVDGAQIWHSLDKMIQSSTGNGKYDLVRRYIQAVRYGAAPNSTLWPAVIEARDLTGLKSSLAGGLLSLEVDIVADDVDDASVRKGISICMLGGSNPSTKPPMQAHYALGVFNGYGAADSACGFHRTLELSSPFLECGIDFRWSGNMPGTTGNAIWLKTGYKLALSTDGTSFVSAGMGAEVLLSADPTSHLGAATKQYVDAMLPLAGGTLTGGLGFGSAVASAANNVSRHLALYGTTFGLSITSGTLNVVANGVAELAVTGTGITIAGAASVGGSLNVGGAAVIGGTLNAGNGQLQVTTTGITVQGTATIGGGFNASSGGITGNLACNQVIANATVFPAYSANANFYLNSSGGYEWINFTVGWALQWRISDGALIWSTSVGFAEWWVDGYGNTHQQGACYATSYPGPSDIRLKDEVEPFDAGLSELLRVKPASWRYNGKGRVNDDGRRHVGIHAQDLRDVIPEAVHAIAPVDDMDHLDEQLAVDPAPIMAAVVNALHEINARLVALERI